MGRMVKRLSGLEIDEVSLVDRPANQHGRVVISKNFQEEEMPTLFDADQNPVDEAELQVGDYVYDEAGNEFQVRDDVEPDEGDEGEEYEEEENEVGKALIPSGPLAEGASRAGFTARAYGARAGNFARKNKKGLAVGGAAGGAAGYGAGRVGKSAGQRFLDEISKAYTDEDRDEVIAKALDGFSEVAKRNEMLEDALLELIEDREHEQYATVAKGYGLGVDESQLGGLLQRAAHSMDPSDVQLIDQLLTSAGQISKALYVEQGVGGYGDSGVLDQVYAIAGEGVAKSDLGMTTEQAVTAIFDTNPGAYDEYLAETAPYNER
jgi:hypothetical protein